MNELIAALLGGMIGAALLALTQKYALNTYFNLVEHVWSNDLKRINDRIDSLLIDRMQSNVVKLSTNMVDKEIKIC